MTTTTISTGILCGNCQERHTGVNAVRACCAGQELSPCDWLVNLGRDEDGEQVIRECRADSYAVYTNDGRERGYECTAGHSHVNCEIRAEEGWDYASDAEEAYHLRRNLVDAVGPDGGSI